MKGKLRAAVIGLIIGLFAVLPVSAVTYHDSDPDDYITEHFNVEATVTEDHVVHVQEKIRVNFIQPHHGITRYIPTNRGCAVKNIDVSGGPEKVSSGSSTKEIRIGDADSVLQGKHDYTISYDLAFAADQEPSYDEIYVDLLPTGWATSIRQTHIKFTMPKDVDPSKYYFYTGEYGSERNLTDEQLDISSDGRTVHIHIVDNPANSGVTLIAKLEQGYWSVSVTKWLRLWELLIFGMLALIVLRLVSLGRRGEIVETVEFYPPDGMTPAEVGYIVDGSIDKQDLGSMPMYYASRGYLKIRQTKKNYVLLKTAEIADSEASYTKTMFNALFLRGAEVGVKRLPNRFYTACSAAAESIENMYSDLLFAKKGERARSLSLFLMIFETALPLCALSGGTASPGFLCIIGLLLGLLVMVGAVVLKNAFDIRHARAKGTFVLRLVVGALMFGAGEFLTMRMTRWGLTTTYSIYLPKHGIWARPDVLPELLVLLAAVVSLLCIFAMRRKTPEGCELYGRVAGFRNFIRDVEYEKMKELSNADPEYFFKIMPYAYVLGLSTEFAKKFADIPTRNPSWYESSDPAQAAYVSPVWCSQISRDVGRSIAKYSSRVDTGGGGYSHRSSGGGGGGGFSGGGGGGGGGGAW